MADYIFIYFIILGHKFGLVDTSFLIPFLLLIFFWLKNSKINLLKPGVLTIPFDLYAFLALMALVFLIALFSTLYNFSDPVPEFILKPLKMALMSLVIYFFFIIRCISINRFLLIVLLVCLTNSIVVYLQYIFDFYLGIKNFLYHPSIGTYSPYRKPGLATGFPTSGLLSAIGAFIALYFYRIKKQKKWMLFFLILSLSVFLSARSAMYLYLLIMPFLFFYYAFSFKRILSVITVQVTLVTVIVLAISTDNPLISGTADKMFANVINYIETGSFHDYSTAHLISEDHLKMPEKWSVILVGNSLDKNSGFQPSDISFIRILWSNGIFSLALYAFSFLMIWFLSINYLVDNQLKTLFFAVFFMIFGMLFKGPYLFSTIAGPIVIAFFIVSMLQNKQERDKKRILSQ